MANDTPLNVSIIEMSGWRVASLTYQTFQASGDFDHAIRSTFDQVKSWVREHGGSVDTVPAIGIASVQDGKLQSYECCIPIDGQLSSGKHPDLNIKVLPGGKYAVVKMEKQSEIIGKTIQRFFEEYVPNTHLQIDDSRPTYEVYWETIMEFCVPIFA